MDREDDRERRGHLRLLGARRPLRLLAGDGSRARRLSYAAARRERMARLLSYLEFRAAASRRAAERDMPARVLWLSAHQRDEER